MALVECEACDGDGVVMGEDGEDTDCPECDGEGRVDNNSFPPPRYQGEGEWSDGQ